MQKPVANSQPDRTEVQKKLIVIVDDDEGIREGLKAFFNSLGYSNADFGSAEEYLSSTLLKADTGCLILDVHLPGMSGPELQSCLIQDGDGIPIVFITGCLEQDVRKRVIAAGALDYLIKPLTERSLINCVERALSAWK